MNKLCLTLLLLMPCFRMHAQVKVSENVITFEEGSKSPAATLDDVAWITGRWTGTGLDGTCEETWGPACNHHMIGTFRMITTEKFLFFAFADLTEVNGSLTMRVKHFNYDMHGWEDKDDYVEFPLVSITENRIYFDAMTMERVDDDHMNVYMTIRYKNGEAKEEKYIYTKSNTSNLASVSKF